MTQSGEQMVVEISGPGGGLHLTRETSDPAEAGLGAQFWRNLRPGTEIAVAFPGYTATLAVIWIAPQDSEGVRAGVRLLGVSAGCDNNSSSDGLSV